MNLFSFEISDRNPSVTVCNSIQFDN